MFDPHFDPYEQLQQLEINLLKHSEYLESISEQLKNHSLLLEKLTGSLNHTAWAIQILAKEIDRLKNENRP